MWKNKLIILALLVFLFPSVLAGCASSGEADAQGATQAVETYMQALADKNGDQMIAVSCGAWEAQAQLELDAFVGVETVLEGVACDVTGTDGDATLVSCSGEIVATYGAEARGIPLDSTLFRVVQDGGEWRVCGRQSK